MKPLPSQVEIGRTLTSINSYILANALINCEARLSTLGGSRLSPDVLDVMAAANRAFLDFRDLEAAVCRELALITRNEAVAVTNGASAGLVLATLASISLANGDVDKSTLRSARVLAPSESVSPYLHVVDAFIGSVEVCESLENCELMLLNDNAREFVAIVDTPGRDRPFGDSELWMRRLAGVAKRHRISLIVDAAAQLPPPENLWRFTRDWGATCAVFSGGKELGGPQTSGLVVGSHSICHEIRQLAFPTEGYGRAFKVGRADLVALLVAVASYFRIDHEERRERIERWIDECVSVLPRPGVEVWRDFPNEAGQPLPRLGIRFLDRDVRERVVNSLDQHRVRVAIGNEEPRVLYVTFEMLTAKEAGDVLEILKGVLTDLQDF
jgi:L-seryl-tRNA(Ser) seleniumtransferase